MKNKVLIASAMVGVMFLSGCAATHTAINKRDLAVSTKMSDSIFLDPVSQSQRVVYVQVRNTSDHQDVDIEPGLVSALQSNGYQIAGDIDDAHYLLQANILQIGETNLRDAEAAANRGADAAVTGAVLGGVYAGGGTGRVGTAIAGGLIGMAADSLVRDVRYSMITDLRISERTPEGVVVTEQNDANLAQGRSGTRSVSSTAETQWQRYDTRIASIANKVNLKFEEALPELEKGLIDSISGIL